MFQITEETNTYNLFGSMVIYSYNIVVYSIRYIILLYIP
jgi:hypothetical protein